MEKEKSKGEAEKYRLLQAEKLLKELGYEETPRGWVLKKGNIDKKIQPGNADSK